jgi:hypothetical protein
MKNIDTTVNFSTLEEKFEKTRLFLDSQARYTHSTTSTGTNFASYIILSPIGYQNGTTYEIPKEDNRPQ